MKCDKCGIKTNNPTTKTNWFKLGIKILLPQLKLLKINIQTEKTFCHECYIDNLVKKKLK
jgi:hypothetical protein